MYCIQSSNNVFRLGNRLVRAGEHRIAVNLLHIADVEYLRDIGMSPLEKLNKFDFQRILILLH